MSEQLVFESAEDYFEFIRGHYAGKALEKLGGGKLKNIVNTQSRNMGMFRGQLPKELKNVPTQAGGQNSLAILRKNPGGIHPSTRHIFKPGSFQRMRDSIARSIKVARAESRGDTVGTRRQGRKLIATTLREARARGPEGRAAARQLSRNLPSQVRNRPRNVDSRQRIWTRAKEALNKKKELQRRAARGIGLANSERAANAGRIRQMRRKARFGQ